MKYFHLSAGLGDVIYSLPTVKAMGGGVFVYGNTYEGYLALKPLLERQDYITECKHVSEVDLPRDFVNLDLFRNNPLGNKCHLVDLFLTYFGFPKYDWTRWLDNIPGLPESRHVIINVTSRYRDKVFDKIGGWKKEINIYASNGIKVYVLGTKEDYDALGNIDATYVATEDLLKAAILINEAVMFCGTQSSLLAIRQGLGLPYRFEQSPNHVDVNQYSDNETVINPITRKIHLALVTLKRLFS